MGHVDHGKTSLLDYIRHSRVAAGEAGGITQHIGAYRVDAGEAHGDIVFLDTPGHAAFTEMRARGAQATDIVVLVCAADDGIMPQTIEALNHAKDAEVPIIIAVNKTDLPQAQPERVRQQLADHGLIPEEWGGETMYIDVSAHTGQGVDKLLEAITLNAELLELQANPEKQATGIVIEAKLDRNRGPMITLLVQEGTLHLGDIVVVGEHMGKVRALMDDKGNTIDSAGPSTPVEVLGIDGVPEAGDVLHATDDEKMAKQVVEHRHQRRRQKELAKSGKVSLENLMEKIQEGETEELKIVLKADVHGSSEALKTALINQSTDKVKVNVISAGVGGITESDVNLAKAGGAIIVGFHVRPAGKSARHAEQEAVEIKLYDIIYEAIDDVRAAMAGLLAPVKREQPLGALQVRETFTIPRRGVVAGCMVTGGKITRKSLLRVVRDAVQIYEGRVSSLRRFKDEAAEVKEGFECGVMIDGFNDLKIGDVIETYEIVEEAATL
jgi:translation initiation factor IF-2